MSITISLFKQVLIILLLISLGYLSYKTKIITKQGNKQLSNLILLVVTPCVILNSYQIEYKPQLVNGLLISILMAFISHIIGIIIAKCFIRNDKDSNKPIEHFSLIYSNCGFMALPLIGSIFGNLGIFYATAYITIFNIFTWTHGVILLSQDKQKINIKKLVVSPAIISILVGLILFFMQIKLPFVISKTVEYMSSLNTPLAMLVVGVYIAQVNLKEIFTTLRFYYLSFLKLFLIPFLMLLILKIFKLNDTLALTNLIAISCPTAGSTLLFATRYKHNPSHASQIITATTLISVISLPILVYIYNLI